MEIVSVVWPWIASLRPDFWIALGLIGQVTFMGRFVVQWIVSERLGRSIIPIYFWYMSIVGSLLLFCYALHRKDPIFILGYSGGSIIYIRNLLLIHKEKQHGVEKGDPGRVL
jgi:lipid-A-disaccharide synthase-like uncharacterized protein